MDEGVIQDMDKDGDWDMDQDRDQDQDQDMDYEVGETMDYGYVLGMRR